MTNNVEEMADVFNKYFADSIREITKENDEGDLLIGNEHRIYALE